MPTTATLGSFISKNSFQALQGNTTTTTTHHDTTVQTSSSTTSGRAQRRLKVADAKKLQQKSNASDGSPRCCNEQNCKQDQQLSIAAAVAEAEKFAEEFVDKFMGSINAIEYSTVESNEVICNVGPERVKVRVAMDSAACANVIDPKELPQDAEFEPNHEDKHFVGANDSRIERFGTCKTIMSSELGEVGCNWDMAGVSRALHSVGIVAGPKGGPGKQDVLFDNDHCYVVAPGIVKALMKKLKAVAQYEREGNLYIGEVTLSGFRRQGPTK